MKKTAIILVSLLWAMFPIMSQNIDDIINGKPGQNLIILNSSQHPHHLIEVTDPVAMYNSVTDVLTVTLDATYYGEYTITIESTLTTVDYYPTSATTVIPLTGADNNISIYIDSDDCGCWYGELDKAEFGGRV